LFVPALLWLVAVAIWLLPHRSQASVGVVPPADVVATPKASFVAPYEILALHASFRSGASFPVRFADEASYYIRVHFGDQQHLVAWPRSDAAALEQDGFLKFRYAHRQSFDKGYLLFSRHQQYEVLDRAGGVLRVRYPTQQGQLTLRVLEAWFKLSLRSDPNQTLQPHKRTTRELDPSHIAQLKSQYRRPRPAPLQPEDYIEAVCILESPDSQGTGFVFWMQGNYYVLTNQHVALGQASPTIRTVTGRTFTPVLIEVAEDRDLARIMIEEPTAAFFATRDPQLDEAVVVLGNSQGAGRITHLPGSINGISAHEIEITAEIVSGNSGSPVIADDDGAVVGVATYLEKFASSPVEVQGTAFEHARRVGVRLDTPLNWLAVDWEQAHQTQLQFQQAEQFAQETLAMMHLTWLKPLEQIQVDLSDRTLQRWLGRRNELVGQFNTELASFSGGIKGSSQQAAFEQWRTRTYLTAVQHQVFLSRLMLGQAQQIELMRPYPMTAFTKQQLGKLIQAFEQLQDIHELAQERIRKELNPQAGASH
jgi:hypothetical protein